jgi:hypothetical protein
MVEKNRRSKVPEIALSGARRRGFIAKDIEDKVMEMDENMSNDVDNSSSWYNPL